MAVAAAYAVTTRPWFDKLAQLRPPVSAFWQVTPKRPKELAHGSRWYFKERGEDRVLGFGMYAGWEQLTVSELFARYGNATGYATLEDLVGAIRELRPSEAVTPATEVGNVALRDFTAFLVPVDSRAVGAPRNTIPVVYLRDGDPIAAYLGGAPAVAGAVGEDWTPTQVQAAVGAYFDMLRRELDGQPYVKAAANERVRASTGRSKGSVEFKFQNISAVLDGMGLRWVDGYKPRGHGQIGAIRDAVEACLHTHQGLADRLEPVRDAPPVLPLIPARVFTDPPPRSGPRQPAGPRASDGSFQRRDRAAADARNRTLGEQGEEFVVRLERRRLTEEGRADLAGMVEWTAREQGDGAGYDVASFNADGSPRLVEVKTTNGPADTPFYVTANEVRVSEARAADYWLYRVYGFGGEPRIYRLKGSLKTDALTLEPIVFRAIP